MIEYLIPENSKNIFFLLLLVINYLRETLLEKWAQTNEERWVLVDENVNEIKKKF